MILKSNIKFFADVTTLYSIVRGSLISANDLNQWRIEFNHTKQATEVL